MSLKRKTLSIREAARIYLHCSPATAYRAAVKGQIPIIVIGGRKRVSVPGMEKLLEAAADNPIKKARRG